MKNSWRFDQKMEMKLSRSKRGTAGSALIEHALVELKPRQLTILHVGRMLAAESEGFGRLSLRAL
jgi:hypothetical protein